MLKILALDTQRCLQDQKFISNIPRKLKEIADDGVVVLRRSPTRTPPKTNVKTSSVSFDDFTNTTHLIPRP